MYKSRRLVIILFFVIALMIISNILLLPTYFLSNSRETLAEQKEKQLADDKNIPSEEVVSQIQDLDKKISALNEEKGLHVYDLVTNITEDLSNSIILVGIRLDSGEQDTIDLSGVATDRESLLSFRRILEQKDFIESVNLPISNFASETDISFNIRLTLKDK